MNILVYCSLKLNLMLLLLQKAVIKAPPTVNDSLKHSLAQMQHKVDSLETVVMKTEIGTGFFSEIISLQLGVFLFLLSIIGWIGWKSFIDRFQKTRIETEAAVQLALEKQNSAIYISVNEMKDRLNQTHYDVCRSMYNSTIYNKQYHLTFGWGIRTAVALYTWKSNQQEDLRNLLRNVSLSAKSIPYKDSYTLSKIPVLNEHFKTLLDIDDHETNSIVHNMIHEFNEALFTPKN